MKRNEVNKNFRYLANNVPKNRITLLQGGTRSGKTFAIIHWIIRYCLRYEGSEIDIVRDTLVSLKATAWHDFESELIRFNLYDEKLHNKSDRIYELNGNFINYYGADTPEKIHGRSRDILWINEAHQFPAKTIDQLFPRTRHRIICDYNPALGQDHWLDRYSEKYKPFVTTYKDNPYLTKGQIAEIEGRKNNPYWWSVYGKGHRAVREGVVFTNWKTGNFDTSLPYGYGQDFGFYPAPTTLVKLAVDERLKKIYVKELFYSNAHLSTDDIFELNKRSIERPNDLIVADSADPRLIYEISGKGLNIIRAEKGAGSVLGGISKMLDYEIIVTPDSKNLISNLSNYVWSDKKAGIPVKDNDHCIDAMRYVFMKLTKKNAYQNIIGTDNII